MEKRDQLALGADSGLLVDQTDACRAAAVESGLEIIHDKAHVMNAGAAFGDELADG